MNDSTRNRVAHWRLLAAVVILVCCGSAALAHNIPTDGNTIGTWDSVNRVYTLTGNVSGPIVIDESDLTLDGAGYTVTGTDPYGIYLLSKSGVTVENVTVEGFVDGIYLALSQGNVLTCNTVESNSSHGIWLDYSSNNTLNGNTVSGSNQGIRVNNATGNTIMENTMSNNDVGVILLTATNTQIHNNNFISNVLNQAEVTGGSSNLFSSNYWSDCNGCASYSFPGGEDTTPRTIPVPSTCGVLDVDIDIKPGSYPNAINLGSNGVVAVAILSSTEFDATTVDADTVALAGAGVAVRGKGNKLMAHEEDVNADGLVDLVVQIETENLNPDSLQDGYAVLTGSTSGGQAITGTDEITIVPLE